MLARRSRAAGPQTLIEDAEYLASAPTAGPSCVAETYDYMLSREFGQTVLEATESSYFSCGVLSNRSCSSFCAAILMGAPHVRTPRKARPICPESAGQLTCSKYRRLAVLRRSRTFSEGLKCATAGRKSRTIRRLFGTGLTPVPLSSELWPSRKTRGWPLPHRPRQIRAKLSHSFSTPLNPNSHHHKYKPDTNQNYHNQPARWGVGLEQHIQGHKHHD